MNNIKIATPTLLLVLMLDIPTAVFGAGTPPGMDFETWVYTHDPVGNILIRDNSNYATYLAAHRVLAFRQFFCRDRPGQVFLNDTAFVIEFVMVSLLLYTGFSFSRNHREKTASGSRR